MGPRSIWILIVCVFLLQWYLRHTYSLFTKLFLIRLQNDFRDTWVVVGYQFCLGSSYIEGILPKGPYPPCLRMADRALLAGNPRYVFSLVGSFHYQMKIWRCVSETIFLCGGVHVKQIEMEINIYIYMRIYIYISCKCSSFHLIETSENDKANSSEYYRIWESWRCFIRKD